MKFRTLLPLLLGLFAITARAQNAISVRIMTEPGNVEYTVDGQVYSKATTFLWPRGSKHVVSIVGTTTCGAEPGDGAIQYDNGCTLRYGFGGWESEKGAIPGADSPTQSFTVDGSFSLLKASFTVQYRVNVVLSEPVVTSIIGACVAKANNFTDLRRVGDSIGLVFIDGACYDYTAVTWLEPGEYQLRAMALSGFVFDGWLINGARSGSLATLNVRGPTVLSPRFVAAKRVRLYTDPPELKVRVDRTDVKTGDPTREIDIFPYPGFYDWLPGSKHVLGAPSPQMHPLGSGMWVFDSWSTGGGQDTVYEPDNETGRVAILTAKFVRGVAVTFSTEPRGLRLKVDGRENWPSYQFVWGLGSKYDVSAPLEQIDSKGRKWTFKGWRHGGEAAQQIGIDQAAIDSGGVFYTAVYQSVPQVVLKTSVPGQTIRVDGAPCQSPCVLDRPLGTQLEVSVPERISANAVSRHDFLGWTDGAKATRSVVFDRETLELMANYQAVNKLSVVTDPADGARLIFDPPSADEFYPNNVAVTITVQPKPGYRFRRWEGDLSGTIAHGIVLMNSPRSVQAMLTRVPELSSASVVNAAGSTPVEGVAPGSLISIFGGSLASTYEAGPASPLAQSIGGVSVLIADRLLPLIFVSPEQINALLPSDLEPGIWKLRVRQSGAAEVSTDITVVRHAPGLLNTQTDRGALAIAQKSDGSAITADQPAKPGELITILGTGFGPYDRPVIDGFATPASPRYTLSDPVEIRLGETTVTPEWAGAAPGFTGLTAVRVRVPEGVSGLRELTATINGAGSNTVLLPIE